MTHYDTLGVMKTATPEELKSAYRKLVKEHHPDRGGDITKFQEISEAYETLTNVNKKAHYDYQLKQTHPSNNQSQYSKNTKSFFRDFEFTFSNDEGIFKSYSDTQRIKNKNIRINLEIPFLDTLDEQIKFLDIKLSQGSETLEVKIPAGIENNTTLTLRNRGDNEHYHLPRGHLEIVVKVLSNDKFFRQGDNIVTDITIDCFEAIVGTEITLDTPQYKKISLKVPAGTQNNNIFGVTDLGFPTYPKNTRGKLLIKINVLVPKNLTNEQLVLIKEIIKLKPINS